MSTRVRAGLAADAASLAPIRASLAAGDPVASAGTPQGGSPGPDYFARWLEKERGLIYVAEIGGAAAGYLAMQQTAYPAVAARHLFSCASSMLSLPCTAAAWQRC